MAVGEKLTAFLLHIMDNAAKLIGASIIGKDIETVFVNGKAYIITPPTINRIAGAGYYLSSLGDASTVFDMIRLFKDIKDAANALSWLIQGNEKLAVQLSKGTFDEVVEALSVAIGMISAENFFKLSVLAKNVAMLTAKQRQ